MAKLRDVRGNRIAIDADLHEREGRKYEALTPEQRTTYIHMRRVAHEIHLILQLARDDTDIGGQRRRRAALDSDDRLGRER